MCFQRELLKNIADSSMLLISMSEGKIKQVEGIAPLFLGRGYRFFGSGAIVILVRKNKTWGDVI